MERFSLVCKAMFCFFSVTQRYGKIGVAIGSDQWYPKVALSLVVQGAELLLYPSAMGSNQYDPNFDPRDQGNE
ncbi:unnamed protein product [Peronospora belbahrii]|uniref:Uncharacterized protein n=1 Tax=Peronospora belbahrii TaxID=622444 RepID=A0AAU9L0X1_9STRA|nr:unnamed protein product [Peronospora belbahrii]